MGSKGVKAIIVDDSGAAPTEHYNAPMLREVSKKITIALKEDPKSQNRKLYGTLDILDFANTIGILPTRNWICGSYEPAKEWTCPKFADLVARRGRAQRNTLRSRLHNSMLKCVSA
jgi:aldehyde:ferredoxin oxidoreductase